MARTDLVALVTCVPGATEQLWHVDGTAESSNGTAAVRLINTRSGKCLDAAYGKPGRLVYTEECQPLNRMPIGQTWRVGGGDRESDHGTIVNVAAKTCITVQAGSPPPAGMAYYNLTSTTETHWPAVPTAGWLIAVDPATKAVTVDGGAHALLPWLNPHANGEALPPAPDCTMVTGLANGALMCKLPWCSESTRPVAAQQFNALALGGEVLYWGERWQSTPSGLKSEDFSYMEPLRFDEKGVMQRMRFTDTFELSL